MSLKAPACTERRWEGGAPLTAVPREDLDAINVAATLSSHVW